MPIDDAFKVALSSIPAECYPTHSPNYYVKEQEVSEVSVLTVSIKKCSVWTNPVEQRAFYEMTFEVDPGSNKPCYSVVSQVDVSQSFLSQAKALVIIDYLAEQASRDVAKTIPGMNWSQIMAGMVHILKQKSVLQDPPSWFFKPVHVHSPIPKNYWTNTIMAGEKMDSFQEMVYKNLVAYGMETKTALEDSPVLNELELPALKQRVYYPCRLTCAKKGVVGAEKLALVIIHLNDEHRWSRERIAEWLDELHDAGTVDLTIKEKK